MRLDKTSQAEWLAIIRNDEGLYEGDLVAYDKICKKHDTKHDFHNFPHTKHVVTWCHDAIKFYSKTKIGKGKIDLISARILLIAARFHDLNRARGNTVPDRENIKRATDALRKFILPCDRPYLRKIIELIKATEFPYKNKRSKCLLVQILREADLSQALFKDWKNIVSSLALEYEVSEDEMLRRQIPFLKGIRYYSRWGKTTLRPLRQNRIKTIQALKL